MISCMGIMALFFGLSACSDSSSDSSLPDVEYSSEKEDSPESSSSKKSEESPDTPKDESSSSTIAESSSSVKSETASGTEELNPPSQTVNGTCAPTMAKINKGDLATWEFSRTQGEVFNQIVAPFVWVFEGGKTDTVSGNGIESVNVRYENSGVFKATLSVDGNNVECSPLQVQGVPIIVESCKPNTSNANAGDVITWTVKASSDSKITSYQWKSTYGDVTGNGAEGKLTTTAAMHKQKVNVSVDITNEDKTTETYVCDALTVVDPNTVDITIGKDAQDSSSVFPGGQTLVAQLATGIVNCQMVCSTTGNGVILEINGESFTIDYSLNVDIPGCTNGSAGGYKFSVLASQNTFCYSTY